MREDGAQAFSGGIVQVGKQKVERLLVQVPLVRPGQELSPLLATHMRPHVQAGDIVFISEKVVSITQGRVIGMWQVTPRPFANFLARFVRRTPHGMGLRQPVVMEMAIREVGVGRIMLAALIGGLTRTLGRSGDFYRVAGRRVAAIDGPNRHTVRPYGYYVILAPDDPAKVATEIAALLGVPATVVDCNDLGSEVLGASEGVRLEFVRQALKGNPMGQGHQRTPMGVLRVVGTHAVPADQSVAPARNGVRTR